ncbi:MAG: hypothetical protein PF501_16690, partial [Salinisphaera sp.]|nr:hypothetical protein [Salinisphaera sp.]
MDTLIWASKQKYLAHQRETSAHVDVDVQSNRLAWKSGSARLAESDTSSRRILTTEEPYRSDRSAIEYRPCVASACHSV